MEIKHTEEENIGLKAQKLFINFEIYEFIFLAKDESYNVLFFSFEQEPHS